MPNDQNAAKELQKKPANPKPKVRLFKLQDIPSVMHSRMNWPVAAAMMNRWFAHGAYEMPHNVKVGDVRATTLNSGQIDETIVKMSWALAFARVGAALGRLQASWASPKGVARLRDLVVAAGKGKAGQCWQFGNLSAPARLIDETCQVNILKLGSLSDPLDDFYGAMGEAVLKVAVSATVKTDAKGKHEVEVVELGFYLRDTYDFNDAGWTNVVSQPLGFWGFNGVERGMQLRWDVEIDDVWVEEDAAKVQGYKYEVQNEDFARFRAKYGRGGDFVVFSDVHRVRLPAPLKFSF